MTKEEFKNIVEKINEDAKLVSYVKGKLLWVILFMLIETTTYLALLVKDISNMFDNGPDFINILGHAGITIAFIALLIQNIKEIRILHKKK